MYTPAQHIAVLFLVHPTDPQGLQEGIVQVPSGTILLALDPRPKPRKGYLHMELGKFVVGGSGITGWIYWDALKPVEE